MSYTEGGFPVWNEEFDKAHFTPEEIAESDMRAAFITSPDMFYSEANMRALRESIEQEEAGKVVHRSMEELEAMAE